MLKGRYPWFVQVSTCGGALITDRHILTSAHCVGPEEWKRKNTRIVLDPHTSGHFLTKPTLEIEEYIVHEGYNSSIWFNDIAILKLKHPMKFENGLNPICLPDFDETDNMFAYGMGKQNKNGKQVSADVMHEVDLDRISPERCSKWWHATSYNLSKTICTLNDKRNTGICFGDSGSPASTRKDGRVYEVGIPSIAPMMCNVDGSIWPNGYEKVYVHLDWIRKHTMDGLYCQAPHHPFTKPSSGQSNYNTGTSQNIIQSQPPKPQVDRSCRCGQLKGTSLQKAEKKPWDVAVESQSMLGIHSVSQGVLISDRHILVAKEGVNGNRTMRMIRKITTRDGNQVWHTKVRVIQLPSHLKPHAVLIELQDPVDISDSSPLSAICLPMGHLTNYFTTVGTTGFLNRDYVFKKTRPAGSVDKCKSLDSTGGVTDANDVCVKAYDYCPEHFGYLMGQISNDYYLTGFPRNIPCVSPDYYLDWMSVPALQSILREETRGGKFCYSDWSMFK